MAFVVEGRALTARHECICPAVTSTQPPNGLRRLAGRRAGGERGRASSHRLTKRPVEMEIDWGSEVKGGCGTGRPACEHGYYRTCAAAQSSHAPAHADKLARAWAVRPHARGSTAARRTRHRASSPDGVSHHPTAAPMAGSRRAVRRARLTPALPPRARISGVARGEPWTMELRMGCTPLI